MSGCGCCRVLGGVVRRWYRVLGGVVRRWYRVLDGVVRRWYRVLGGVVHRWYRVLGGVVRRWYCRQWAGRVPSLVAWLATFSANGVRLAAGGRVPGDQASDAGC